MNPLLGMCGWISYFEKGAYITLNARAKCFAGYYEGPASHYEGRCFQSTFTFMQEQSVLLLQYDEKSIL